MLKLKNVSKYYYKDGVIAEGFSKVNLELHMGEFVVITGESGSGKSTLLNVLSGLDTYEDGEMYINGEETSHYTEADYLEYRKKYVSNIFQNFNLVNSYTVYENIELTMLINGYNRRNVKSYINDLIDRVGLKKFRNTKASKLSGGQKQRVAIARALANDTPIIVADEPTGNLDSKSSKEILKLLADISKDKLVIVVTHNKKEIEEYATRLINMHDGKILENKVISKINLDDNVVAKDTKDISLISKIRLGIRNTFNLPIKFILMIIIFLLITITLLTNYASIKVAENEETTTGYNEYFNNYSDNRIVINKQDKSPFTMADYANIKNIPNVDYVVEKDLLNDYLLTIHNDNLYFDGFLYLKEVDHVDVGRLPINDNEIVIKGSKDNWYISEYKDELLKSNLSLDEYSKYKNIKIVGIIYTENATDLINSYALEFIVSDSILNDIATYASKNYTNTTYVLNNNYFNEYSNLYLNIEISSSVKEGEVYIKDTLNMYCKYNNCLNSYLKVNTNNIYYSDSKDLKITKIYNKNNAKDLLNLDYNNIDNTIFMNENDYNSLYNKENYQSSVFIKEIKDLDKTKDDLSKLGYTSFSLREAKHNEAATVAQIFKIFKLVFTIILIVTLFFISYFIIKIIYKSRNSYYTTLRTLGSTKRICINILMRELITLATTAYFLFIGFLYLVSKDIIRLDYFKDIIKYTGIYEYIIVYLILIILSILIAYRYGRKIFKDSIIKTYGGNQ